MNNGHYELYPSESNLVLALVVMVRRFKWSQISVLTQNEQPFLQVWYNCTLRIIIHVRQLCAFIYIQIEEMVIQEFSATNTTVLPPSRFSTGQDINSIPVCEYNLSLQIVFN